MTEKLLVTDTHPLIYYFCDGGRRLSEKSRQAFEEAVANEQTAIFVPAPVLWEMSMLVEDNAIELSRPFAEWVDELFRYPMFNPLAFDENTVKIFHDLRYHADPFDRAIAATALQMELPLISNDGKMHKHKPCQLFWD